MSNDDQATASSARWSLPGIALIWAILCLLFFWDVVWAPADSIVGGNDLANMFQLWLDFARSAIDGGALLLWNSYLFSGAPFFADPQPALAYPPTWLALAMPATRALGLILVLHIWWAAVGMTGWLRADGASWWGALAGGAVFAFSGYTFARIQAGHIGVLTTGAWLPWILWATCRVTAVGQFNWRSVALGAIAVGMALLAGHTATFVLLALVIGLYTLYRTVKLGPARTAGPFGRLLLMVGLGLGLASVQLLPFLQLLATSSRVAASDYEFASRFSWPVGYLVTLIVPNFFGEPVRTGYWGEGVYDELVFYVGILPLLLAWAVARWRRPALFWLALGGGSLLLAFGSYGIVHRLFFRFVPLFSSMRAPARAGMIFTLAAGVLVALAVTALERSTPAEREKRLAFLNAPLIATVLGVTAVLVIVCYLLYAWGRESNPEAGRLWHLAGEMVAFGLFFALAAIWLRGWSGSGSTRWLPALGFALVLLDLWTLGGGLVQVVPAPESAYWRIVAAHTNSAEGRVLPWGLNMFEQNGAIQVKVRSVFGYNPLEDQRYNDLVSSVPDPRARAYDLLNTAYVVSKSPLELVEGDTLVLHAQESGVYIYRRTSAMPRAWVAPRVEVVDEKQMISRINEPAFDPLQVALLTDGGASCSGAAGGVVKWLRYDANRLLVQVAGGGGLLVLSERDAPGWQATIDGEPADILPVDGILRGICVPAGSHQVELSYLPMSLTWGAILSGMGWLAVGVLLWLGRRRAKV